MSSSLNYFLPYQRDWIADEAKTAVAEKSRRIGLTYAESYRSVERRIKLETNHYFASRDKESAGEFIDYCKMWARVFNVVAQDLGEQVVDEQSGLLAFVLKFDKGQKIVALSSNPDVFRSKGGDVTLDEFAFHREQRKVLKAANASAKIWGHNVRIISTHNGEGTLFNQICRAIKDGKRDWALHTTTLPSAVEQGLVEKIRNLPSIDPVARQQFLEEVHADCIDESEWQEEYCCQPSSDESSLLTYELIRSCEASNLRLLEPSDLETTGSMYVGWDIGRKKDLSVLWVLRKIGDVYWTRSIIRLKGVDYTTQEMIFNSLMRNPAIKRVCIDSTGIGDMLAERARQKWGYRAEQVTFTNAVKSELAMPLLRLFQDKLVRIPAIDDVREGLHKVRKIVTASNNVRLDADRDEAGHADEFWALALAYHAADDLKLPLPASRAQKPVGW